MVWNPKQRDHSEHMQVIVFTLSATLSTQEPQPNVPSQSHTPIANTANFINEQTLVRPMH